MKKNLITCIYILLFCFVLGCSKPAPKSDTVVIWHWMTDRKDAFLTLAQKYEQETGVKIKFELYAPSDIYSDKIVSAAQANILPDVYGILDKKGVVASFIQNGYVADLTEEFQKDNGAWKNVFFAKALAVNQFGEGNVYKIKPGIYGVPIDVTNMQMLYNKKLLQKAGIQTPPKTFGEFINAVKALKRVGVSGLVSGWGELWLLECFASNYAFNIMGEEKIMATYRGEVPYTDPDWLEVFGVFEQLSVNGALIEGIVTKANKDAELAFALERAAFAFNGSWCVNVYHEMNPKLDYGVMMPPPLSDQYPLKIWGGAGSSFFVNNASQVKDKAVAFLKWLTAKDQQIYLSRETKNLPANREALSGIPQVLSDFASAMEKTTHTNIWERNEDALVAETFNKGIQSIIIGEKTPQQVAEEVQSVKVRQMEKMKRRQQR